MPKSSDDGSGDEDDAAGIQAQVAQMLNPINSKLKKATKKISALDALVDGLKKFETEHVPKMAKDLTSGSSDIASRLERVQAEVAQLATKTQLELARQESRDAENRFRTQLDEERSKSTAMQLTLQAMEARLDTMERADRAREIKVSSELSAAVAQLSQLSASIERQKGEFEAKLGEAISRSSTQYDNLLARLTFVEEEQRTLQSTLASKSDLAELNATITRRGVENEEGLVKAQAQWKASHEALEEVKTNLVQNYATVTSLDGVEKKVDGTNTELKKLLKEMQAGGEESRAQWEDKLMQRQKGLESAVQEGRRDWHRLNAQMESVSTYVSERATLTEFGELKGMVEALQAGGATKEELGEVASTAKSAATGADFQVLEAEVRALSSAAKAEAASSAERFGRLADGAAFVSLEERVNSMQLQLESKFGNQEAQFALGNKLEKAAGDAIGAEVQAMQQRVGQLNDRANESELAASQAESHVHAANARIEVLAAQVADLEASTEGVSADNKERGTDIHDLVKAVRALTADAEMRCALDEREIEFLWAAPSHIYGSHGWRPNNGSKSERTPYPVGNFKMAVRHGTEGNARDVLKKRQQWLNSITVGRRQSDISEYQAIMSGAPAAGNPVRLPDIDEVSKYKGNIADDATGGGGSPLLEPAHSLISHHPAGGGVGVGLRPALPGSRVRPVVEGGTV